MLYCLDRVGVEHLTDFREFDTVRSAHKKSRPKDLIGNLKSLVDSRGSKAQLLCGLLKVPLLGNRNDGGHQVHGDARHSHVYLSTHSAMEQVDWDGMRVGSHLARLDGYGGQQRM